MPIYEYQCQSCGQALELMQRFNDPAPEQCPQCQGGPVTKLMSRTAFVLKGGGWYVTDFRGGQKPQTATSKDGEAAAATTGDKADAPAAKADAAKDAASPAPAATSKEAGATAPASKPTGAAKS